MGRSKTYDQVSWHFPEGRGCSNLESAKLHFEVIMQWLHSEGLLSEEGLEALELGVDTDFALTSHMVTEKGNRVLGKCYSKWLRTIRYGEKPSTELLDKCLSSIK